MTGFAVVPFGDQTRELLERTVSLQHEAARFADGRQAWRSYSLSRIACWMRAKLSAKLWMLIGMKLSAGK